MDSYTTTPLNVTVSNVAVSPGAGNTIIGWQIAPNSKVTGPLTISGCNITATGGVVTYGYLVKACTDLTISGGTVTACATGIRWEGYSNSASDADLTGLALSGITFVGSTVRDIYFANSGATKNPTGTISNCTYSTATPTLRMYFEQSTMLNMTVTNATPYTYASYGGTSVAMQPWGKDIITPINNRVWAQMLYGNYDQVLLFQFTGTELFTDKTQAGGVNINLAGAVNFQAANGTTLTLQFSSATLEWTEIART
jgi:hypothetical protein